MKQTLKKWATERLFTGGGKSGEPTKLEPREAIRGEGTQPGDGQKISAEELNYTLHALQEVQALAHPNALEFTTLEVTEGGVVRSAASSDLVVSPQTGRTYGSIWTGTGSTYVVGALTGTSLSNIDAFSPPSQTTEHISGCVGPDVNGRGPGFYVFGCSSTLPVVSHSNAGGSGDYESPWNWNPDEFDNDSGAALPGADPTTSWFCASVFDDVNGAAVVVYYNSGEVPVPYYVTEGPGDGYGGASGHGTLQTSPAPGVAFDTLSGDEFQGSGLCTQAGTTLFAYPTADNEVKVISTSDAGATAWAELGTVSIAERVMEDGQGAGPGRFSVLSLTFQQDFRGLGSDVYLLVLGMESTGDGSYSLPAFFTSADGVTWTEWVPDVSSGPVLAGASGCRVIGDHIYIADGDGDERRFLTVYDMKSGRSFKRYTGSGQLFWDGRSRLYWPGLISGHLRPPLEYGAEPDE